MKTNETFEEFKLFCGKHIPSNLKKYQCENWTIENRHPKRRIECSEEKCPRLMTD